MKTITKELCGREFNSASISRIVQQIDEELQQFGNAAMCTFCVMCSIRSTALP